ncbi:MAG TPA: Rieske (2Fe-2S) protein [Candidatus Limnocylindria bacterium]
MLERAARPLAGLWNGIASVMDAIYRALGGPGRFLQDFLNGVWLGHSLHAVLVDVVVGGATAALLLDLLRVVFGVDGMEVAATWITGLVVLAALGAFVSGLTDFKDTAPGDERNLAGMHGLINIVGTLLLAVSLISRLGDGHGLGFWMLLIGYLVLSVGAFIGGHVVFKFGAMINHTAHPRSKRAKEFSAVLPAADLPEGQPTKAMLGNTALVLVRRGDVVNALRETCSHAGGPLSQGEVRGDVIICPWHYSNFHLTDGAVRHGPSTHRQPAYRARINEGQVEVQGPIE